jgi:hypothetical protein
MDASNDNFDGGWGYLVFAVLTLVNIPLFLPALFRENPTGILSPLYFGLYVFLIVFLFVTNPHGILNTAMYDFMPLTIVTCAAFAALHRLTMPVIVVFSAIALSLAATNMMLTYSLNPSNYVWFAVYMIAYAVAYLDSTVGLWNTVAFVMKLLYTILYPAFYLIEVLKWMLSYVQIWIPYWPMKMTLLERIKMVGSLFLQVMFAVAHLFQQCPTVIWVVFALTAVYIYIRSIMLEYYGGLLLLNLPISLSNTSEVKLPNHGLNIAYSMSCWIYFDAVSAGHRASTGEYTQVLLYREQLMITYNAAKNRIRFELKNAEEKAEFNIDRVMLQKWNNLIFVYSPNGVIDLFWNGELHSSSNMVVNFTNNQLFVGAHSGIEGRICNILLFREALSPERIQGLYTHAMHQNPPVS